MYYINKIVGWVMSPLGVLFLGLFIGFLLRFWGAQRKGLRVFGAWVVGLSLVSFWVLGLDLTTRVIGLGLEAAYCRAGLPHGSVEDLPTADAIVILGGGMSEHAKCGASEMQFAADRVWQGARLYRAEKASLVMLSGGGVEKSTVPLLEDFGVPRESMKFFPEARNTEEEAQLIAASGTKKILLVTSAWHMDRAQLLFKRAGLEVIPAPTDFEFNCAAEAPLRPGEFFPTADALARNSWAIKEWVALLGYKLLRR